MNGTCECPQTTSEARASLAIRATSERSSLGAGEIEREHVREMTGARVDVSADREQRRDLRQTVQHGQITDVARVQDRVGSQRLDAMRQGAVRPRMGIGDGHDANRCPAGARQGRRLLHQPWRHDVIVAPRDTVPVRCRPTSS
jgi:hypothetical protein